MDLPDSVQEEVRQLRELEKSVRNPLAHLIKPFDEAELYRTTGFSLAFYGGFGGLGALQGLSTIGTILF